VIPTIGAALMWRTWVADIRTWQSPDLGDDGVGLLAQTLLELVPEGGRIGVPMGPETSLRMPVLAFERLKAAIAPSAFGDATTVVRRVREVKSAAEILKIRAACGVADRAFARLPEIAGVGRGLDAVFRDFQIACLEAGADWVPYLAGGVGPGGYSDVISPASAVPLTRGDVLMLDTGVIRDGYFCDFDRNVAIGMADDDARRAYAALHAATEAGLAAARPGVTAAALHRVMQAALGTAGARDSGGRLGHGLGLQLTEWPSLMPGDQTVLREGMVLTLEPGVVVRPGRIMVQEENIVLRADGAELLSLRAPAELPVIG
jgi:Xaa-Pro aminopeptidase